MNIQENEKERRLSVVHRCDFVRMGRTALITRLEARLKTDLRQLSTSIAGQLRSVNRNWIYDSADNVRSLVPLFAQGALIQYQCGDFSRASELCLQALKVFQQIGQTKKYRGLSSACMVPFYINLGRLLGYQGDVSESINVFTAVSRLAKQEEHLELFGYVISVDEVPALLAACPSCDADMVACSIIDVSRMHLLTENYDALLRLTEAAQCDCHTYPVIVGRYLAEVRCRALVGLQQWTDAFRAFDEFSHKLPKQSGDFLMANSLLCSIQRGSGEEALARTSVAALEEALYTLEATQRQMPLLMRLGYQLALESFLLGDDRRALQTAAKTYRWTTYWKDQPGQLRCAMLICRILESSGRNSLLACKHWRSVLEQLAAGTLFKVESAYAYWELGAAVTETESSTYDFAQSEEWLRTSLLLFASMPTVDSKENVRQLTEMVDTKALPQSCSVSYWGSDLSSLDSSYEMLMATQA